MSFYRKNKQHKVMGAILPGVVRDKGWEIQLDLHSIFPHWQEIVDETTAAHANPLKILKGVLWIEVENSAWLQQLQFQKVVLLESINGFLKNSKIDDIRFTLPQNVQKEEKDENRIHFVAPPPEELQEFEEQVSFIEDQEIRESLTRLWYLSKACIKK